MLKNVDFSNAITFSRPGVKWVWGPSGLLEKVPVDTPAFPYPAFQTTGPLGQVFERPTFNFWLKSSNASAMSGRSSFNAEQGQSLFLTEQTCYKLTNKGEGGSRSVTSEYLLLSGSNVRCVWTIVEMTEDTSQTSIGIRDVTQGTWCGMVTYHASTGDLEFYTLNSSGTLTPKMIGPYVLTENGPNGGRVVLIGVATDADPDSYIRGYLYPTGTSVNQESVYVHHCQLETGENPTSAIVTDDSPPLRDGDIGDLVVPSYWQQSSVGTFIIEVDVNLATGHTKILTDPNDGGRRPFYFTKTVTGSNEIRSWDGNTAPRILDVASSFRAGVSWDENTFKIACEGQIDSRAHSGALTQMQALRFLENGDGSILIKDLQYEKALYSDEKLLEAIQ